MESLEQKIDALRAIGPFAELPTARLRPVAQAVEVWVEHAPDRPLLLRTLRSGQLFGETAVLYRGPRSATIKAKTDVTTLKLAGPVFLELLQSSPDLAVRVAVILAQRLASDRYALASDPMTSGAA